MTDPVQCRSDNSLTFANSTAFYRQLLTKNIWAAKGVVINPHFNISFINNNTWSWLNSQLFASIAFIYRKDDMAVDFSNYLFVTMIFINFNHCIKAFCSQSLWQSLSISVSLLTKSIKYDPFSGFPKMIRVFLFWTLWAFLFFFSKNNTMP